MTKAPSFFLTAIGAARVVGGPPGPGSLLLLIFHGHAGAEIAYNINALVRERFPEIEQLHIASIVDLRHVPRFMQAAVKQTISAAYNQVANRIPDDLNATEYVIIAPDWEGKVTNAFGMAERTNDIGLALITNDWQIFDTYLGADPAAAALGMVAAADKNPTLESAAEV